MGGFSKRLPWLAALALHACSSSSSPTPGPLTTVAGSSDATRTSAPTPVESVPASADEISYGLAPGRCDGGSCPAVLQLRSRNQVLDSVALGFGASSAELRREESTEPGAPVGWTAGREEGAVTTELEPVRLAPGNVGVLVQQTAGFDHVKRRQDLFARDDARLKPIWSAVEGAGPTWSAAEVVDAGGQRDEIVHLKGFRPDPASRDELDARRLAWDAARREMVERPVGSLPAVIAGAFGSVRAARRAAEVHACLAGYWVLPAERFAQGGSRFVLAYVAADERRRGTELRRPCDEGVKRRRAEFRPR